MPRWVNVVRRDNPSSGEDSPTSIVRLDDVATTYVPVVTTPPAPAPSWMRRIAPWAVFGVVAVVVVGATTAWSASMRGPERPLLASVPSTYAAVPQATSVVVPPPAEPTAEPEPERAAVAPTKARRAATPTPQPQPVAPPPPPPPAPPPPPPAPVTTAAPAPTSVSQSSRPTTTRTTTATTTRRQPLFSQPPSTTPSRAGTSG